LEYSEVVRLIEEAALVALSAREGAVDVAEELALEERLGDRPAVHRDERRGVARVRVMDRARHELLPLPVSPVTSTRKLFDAGQIGYADLPRVQRDLKEAQRPEVEPRREASMSRWTLEIALGWQDAQAPAR